MSSSDVPNNLLECYVAADADQFPSIQVRLKVGCTSAVLRKNIVTHVFVCFVLCLFCVYWVKIFLIFLLLLLLFFFFLGGGLFFGCLFLRGWGLAYGGGRG